MSGGGDIVESISAVEFDADDELFHATYDSACDSTSLAIVTVVATALDTELCALSPLQSTLDTEALNNLVSESSTDQGCCDSISFSYEGFEVTVTGEGVIEAVPLERT